MRKPVFCMCENKDADQLRGNREADQRLCFRYTDSTIPLLPKSEISSISPSSLIVQSGLCGTWSETPKTGFLTTRLNYLPRFNRSAEDVIGITATGSPLVPQVLEYLLTHFNSAGLCFKVICMVSSLHGHW